MDPCIVWIRNDLRLDDNPALLAASKTGRPLILCFIWSEDDQTPYLPGGASRAWLHDSLLEFNKSLKDRLIIRKGSYLEVLEKLITETKSACLYWNRCYEPHFIVKDKEIMAAFKERSIDVQSFNGNLLFEPWELATKQNKPFQVFTPFYKACQLLEVTDPFDAPSKLLFYSEPLAKEKVEALSLLTRSPSLDLWQPGEEGAKSRLEHFINRALSDYAHSRDFPALDGTSRLSAHLHFGEISVRRLYKRINELETPSATSYIRELFWREFAAHLLFYFPKTPDEPMRTDFARFPWRRDPQQLTCWQQGVTGYPIVDAGMRELKATGWMHNRVRMIVGSFLVKHLLLSWKEGEAWFWEKLFDADLANNALGWQWVAGCGADAAPYFRIFNPILQGKKFDPKGIYVKKWVPELRAIPDKCVHTPWLVHCPEYHTPIVDLDFGRMRALEAFTEMKNGKRTY